MQFQPYQTGSWDLSHRGPHRLGAPFVSQGSSFLQQRDEPAPDRRGRSCRCSFVSQGPSSLQQFDEPALERNARHDRQPLAGRVRTKVRPWRQSSVGEAMPDSGAVRVTHESVIGG